MILLSMDLSTRIRAARIAAGLTQAALGEALGVSHTQIARWETGRAEPRIAALLKLAAALGVEVDSLIR